MKQLFTRPFLLGLLTAALVVVTDILQAADPTKPFSWNAVAVAVGIAVLGYFARGMSGLTNSYIGMVGAALLTIIPLLTEGVVDWKYVALAFISKVIGLLTQTAHEKPVANVQGGKNEA